MEEYEEEEYEEEDMASLAKTNRYTIDTIPHFEPYLKNPIWEVIGDLQGDIDWNNIDATITLQVPYPKGHKDENYDGFQNFYQIMVSPFTNNCGVKALHHISCSDKRTEFRRYFLNLVESFLYYCCNCGIIVGSDFIDGNWKGTTGEFLKQVDMGYTFTAPVWNPNYKFNPHHNIFTFYKALDASTLINYWR